MILSSVHAVHAATTSITVYSQTSDGATITGMYVVLYDHNGVYVTAGYTPITWSVTSGKSYEIAAENYGPYSFSQWSGGSTANPVTVAGTASSLTAIYSSSGGSGGGSGASSITVNAIYGGGSLGGMFVALEQGGSVVGTGFTPVIFPVVAGESYQVLADSYGQYAFSQWSDGSTADPDTVAAPAGTTITLTASYGGSPPAGPAGGGGSSSGGGLGVVIPLYAYPNSVWQSVINYHAQYPSVHMMVVINPGDGPGYAYDPTIAGWVSQLQGAGITVLGYVSTGYTSFALSQVESQVNDYVEWYGVHAVFVDDMENVPGYEWYYQDLANYAYGDGINYILGNPGTSVTAGYVGIFSNIGTYENSGVPSTSLIQSYTMGYAASGFSFIAYDAGQLPSQSYFDSVAQYVSWVYVTDATNSWTTLPSYMAQEMTEIAAA